MKPVVAEIVYYAILTLGYVWAAIQLLAEEPFDALVLFTITWYLQSYRNGIRTSIEKGE